MFRWCRRSPTFYYDDKTLPSLPASVLNVMQAGRAANRPFISSAESAQEQTVHSIRLRGERAANRSGSREIKPIEENLFLAGAPSRR